MHQKFNTNRHCIASKIFIPQPPLQGQVWTNLNITILPDYLVYIKNQLTKQQQMIISDYHLQTYLLQTALKPHPKNDFDACTNQIIAHLRNHSEFWVRKIGSQQEKLKMHLAIQEYQKECQAIQQTFKRNYEEKKESIEEKQYHFRQGIKIWRDYTYDGNFHTKGAHRFSAVLFPWISSYIINYKFKKQIAKLENFQQFKTQVGQFIVQFICILASKAKLKPKKYQPPLPSHQQLIVNQIQNELKQFLKYLQDKNVDTRCLSNFKDYFVITNSLYIMLKFQNYNKIQNNSNQMQIQNQEDYTKLQSEKIQNILADIVNQFIKKQEREAIQQWLMKGQYVRICGLFQLRNQYQQKSKQKWRGLISTQAELQAAYQAYNQIMNHPQNINRMKYKLDGSQVGWTQEQYLKFLQSFLQFFTVPTNNKKIALAMGKDIEPNHVKHVKGLYMRNMNIRIENGQIGGGRKGTFESKIQFLKKDVQNFNMKWFKKQPKNKTKKIKRKRKRETFDEQEQDSDY